jgi:hypothetical protein
MNRFIIFGVVSVATIVAVLGIIRFQQQIDQLAGHPNASIYLTLIVLVIQTGLIFLEIGGKRLNMIEKRELMVNSTSQYITLRFSGIR